MFLQSPFRVHGTGILADSFQSWCSFGALLEIMDFVFLRSPFRVHGYGILAECFQSSWDWCSFGTLSEFMDLVFLRSSKVHEPGVLSKPFQSSWTWYSCGAPKFMNLVFFRSPFRVHGLFSAFYHHTQSIVLIYLFNDSWYTARVFPEGVWRNI